jgi:DNA-binding PadR family transcriptional regulator
MATGRAKRRRSGAPVNAAVLALVIEKPSYGYEVWQRFEARFGGLLDVGSSRIYQAVNGLLDDGLIEELPGGSEGSRRQPRPCYRATARGTSAHRAWLAEELRADPTRLELSQRLLAVAGDDAATLLEVVDRYEEACLDEMAELRTSAHPTASAVRGRLLAEERRLVLEARMKWILFARRQLQAMGMPSGSGGAAEPS